MPALTLVSSYVNQARSLLQDETAPYRYSDNSLISALSFGMLEARRLRPDLFIGRANAPLPDVAYALSDTVEFDQQYRLGLLYFIVGHAQLRDEEDTQDPRAAAFLAKFTAKLLSLT